MSKYDDYESDWIIAVANTAADGISVYRFRGTADKVKAKLAELAKKDMEMTRITSATSVAGSSVHTLNSVIITSHIRRFSGARWISSENGKYFILECDNDNNYYNAEVR